MTWKSDRDRKFAVATVLMLGAALGAIAYGIAAEAERKRALAQIEIDLTEWAAAIGREFAANAEVLHSVRSFYEIRGGMSSDEFSRFARNALARRPTIRAIEWIPRVANDDRESHEIQARMNGLERYHITDFRRTAAPAPTAVRDEYYPVRLVEPAEGNEHVLGFDLASERVRRSALVRAQTSRVLTLTDPVSLVEDATAGHSVLAFAPVFTHGSSTRQPGDAGVEGFVLGVFCFGEIVGHSLSQFEPRTSRFRFLQLIDEDVDGQPQVVYPSTGENSVLGSPTVHSKRLEFGGQQWSVAGQPSDSYLASLHTPQPVALGLSVFLSSILLAGLAFFRRDRLRDDALHRQARLLDSVLHSVNDGVIVADKKGQFLLANEAARRIVGRATHDLTPTSWAKTFGLYQPDGETLFALDQLPLARAIRGEATQDTDVLVRNEAVPDGVWVRVRGFPLRDTTGYVRGGVVVFRDVNERKRSEEARQQLSNAVEQTDDTVLITDRDGTIEYVNPAFERTTGYSRDEVLGKTPRILKSNVHDRSHYETLWSTILRGDVHRGTAINRKKDGTLYQAEQTITPIRDSGGRLTHFVSVVKDMTERNKVKEQEVEMRVAGKVQQRLYPQLAPRVAGFDVSGLVVSADATCGDYFDYFDMGSDGFGIAIGDVCGHGVGAALVMAETRAYLRMVAGSVADPAEILGRTNRLLAGDLEDHRYVALVFARIDTATGRLSYANAGHLPGYTIDRAGMTKDVLSSTGSPLGMFEGSGFETGDSVTLEPGELAVFFTDGVPETENRDREAFGIERALAVVAEFRHESAQRIAERLADAARNFAQGQPTRDDVTIVVCRRER